MTAIGKIDFWEGDDWALPCVSWIFLSFHNSLRSLVFFFFLCGHLPSQRRIRPFDNSWRKSYVKFIIVDIKTRFTCGESNFHRNTVACQRYYGQDCLKNFDFHFRYLTHLITMHPFSTPWKLRKTLSFFWCFQWVEKECTGNKWVTSDLNFWI